MRQLDESKTMKQILATVRFGQKQITATWDFVDATPTPYLIIKVDQDGNAFVIKLNPKSVKDMGLEQKGYVGELNSADGYILKNC